MLDLGDTLSRWWRRQWAVLRDPRARAAWVADVRLVFPLSWRQLVRHRGRSALLALVICLAVGLYLVASAVMSASIEQRGAQALPLDLPADIILYGPSILVGGQLRPALSSTLGMRYSEAVVVKEVYGERGRALAVGTTFPTKLFAQLGLPAQLREELLAETPRGVFPPAWGYQVGDWVWLAWWGETGWQEARVQVGALYPASAPGEMPLVAQEVFTGAGEQLNGWWGFERHARTLQRPVMRRLQDGDQLLAAMAPQTLLRQLSSQAMGPVRLLMGLGVMLAVLGMFNLLLLAFLQRKRQLGTLRALGLESGQLGLLLTLEGMVMTTVGLALGWALGALALVLANRTVDIELTVAASTYLGAALVAGLVFLLASWIPVRLCRLATVDQLLHARRVYLNPNPSCVNCGRCGGF